MFLTFDNEHLAKDDAGVTLTYDEVLEAKEKIRKAADKIFREHNELPGIISIWLANEPVSFSINRPDVPEEIFPRTVTAHIIARRNSIGQRFYVAVFRDKIA